MSESSSTSRPISSHSFPGVPGSSSGAAPLIGGNRSVRDDEPTVISSEPPLIAPYAAETGPPVEPGGLLPGDRLEHFELLEYVGGGGMGRVFRARDTRLNRIVALKVLAPTQAGDDDALARFQNEAQSAARLDHENIARVFHVGEDRALHYIVFEYIEGVNLRVLVHENGPLPVADAINYTLQVAEALAHTAGRDVVHRDIKPSNVLVMPSGRAKLIDMGLARLHKVDTVAADLTASGVTLGTFDYISPEQARDPRNADVRSDIYSLGCTFFFMLAGRPPFPEGTVLQKLLQHQGDEPPDVRQFRPDTPDGLLAVLRRMMAKDPRDRYATASELLDDLSSLAKQLGLRPLSGSSRVWELPSPPRVPRWAYHLPWLAPTVALLCVVAALHVFGGNDAPPPPILGGPEVLVDLPDPAEFMSASNSDDVALPVGESSQNGINSTVPRQVAPLMPEQGDIQGAVDATKLSPVAPDVASDQPIAGDSTSSVADSATAHPLSSGPVRLGRGGGGLASEPASGSLSLSQSSRTGIRLPVERAESGRVVLGPQESVPPPAIQLGVEQPAGVLIVNSGGKGEAGFPSLTAALAVAETGNVIELRYNGPREQTPLRLSGRRLTIRGGEEFHPAILFQPGGNDPVEQPQSMVSLASGELRLVNIAVTFDVSRKIPAEKWSLLEVSGGAKVSLQGSTLSIHNALDDGTAYHPNVAFFRTRPAAGTDRVTAGLADMPTPPVTIELVDCCVRGQAALLRSEAFQPVALDWENGFFATSEQLVSLAAGAHVPAESDVVQLNLRHLTALLGGGLLTTSDRQPATRQMPAAIHLSNSILVGVSGVPLLDQYGEAGEDPRTRIRFQGARNFYEGFDLFWRIQGSGDARPPVLLNFDAWQSHWGSEDENLPSLNRVRWLQVPQPRLPAHRVRVADVETDPDATDNPVRGTANNGRDAGCDPTRLPEFPAS